MLISFNIDGWITSKIERSESKKTLTEILRIEYSNNCFKLWEKISFIDTASYQTIDVTTFREYEFNEFGYNTRLLEFSSDTKDTLISKFGYDKYNRIRYTIENNQSESIYDGTRHLIGFKKTEGDTQFNSKKFHYELINDTLFVYSGFSNERGTSVHPWDFYCYNKEGKFVRQEYLYPEYIIYKTTKTKRTLRHWRRKKIEHYKFSGKYLIGKITDPADPEMKFIYY